MRTTAVQEPSAVHISRLRFKLGAVGQQIQTVAGVGYRFSEDQQVAEKASNLNLEVRTEK